MIGRRVYFFWKAYFGAFIPVRGVAKVAVAVAVMMVSKAKIYSSGGREVAAWPLAKMK